MENGEQQWEERIIPNDKINIIGLFSMLPLALVAAVPFGLIHGGRAIGLGFSWMVENPFLLAVILFGSIIIHEALHALGWALFGRISLKEMKFGILKGNPYTHVKVPISARGYKLGGALPGFVLGVVPGLISLINGSGPLMLFAAVMLAAAAGDVIMLWLLHDLQPDTLVRDHPSAVGCLVLKEK
jgi:hypothetical protein